jgi:probable rRNA maturation factor
MKPRITLALADISVRMENKKILYSWIQDVIESEKRVPSEIAIILCSDEYLLDMNNKFLKHNYYTDIITFDYTQGKMISGELYISVDRVRDNAIDLGVGFKNELYRVIIHGILHLCGYGDKSEKERKEMRRKENQKLKMLEI